MATLDASSVRLRGLVLDTWGDLRADLALLEAEVAEMEKEGVRGGERRRLTALIYELGRLRLAVGNEVEAAQAFRRAYALRPRFRPTLRASQGLYEIRGDYKLYEKLLGAEAAASKAPAVRAALVRRQAQAFWHRLSDPPAAAQVLEAALEQDPGDLVSLELHLLVTASRHDRDGVERALKRLIRLLPPSSLSAAFLGCRACLAAREQPKQALAALSQAQQIAPGLFAIDLFQELLLGELGNSLELSRCWEERAARPGEAPERRAALLTRAARVSHQELDDGDRALGLWLQSLALHPSAEAAMASMELLLARERWAEAVAVGEQVLAMALPSSETTRLAWELGEVLRGPLARPSEAARCFLRALELDPVCFPALEGLEALPPGTVEDAVLIEARRRLVDALPAREARTDQVALARHLERCGRDEEALRIHEAILAEEPTFLPSRLAEERLFARLGRYTELLQFLDEQLGRTKGGEEALRIRRTMASIWLHHLGEPESALECYREVLADNPHHLPSIRAAARLAHRLGRFKTLAQLTELEVVLTSGFRRRADLLCSAAGHWLTLGHLEQARSCHEQAIIEDPDCFAAFHALQVGYRNEGKWPLLLHLLERRVETSQDPEERRALHLERADIAEHALADLAQAAEAYRAATPPDSPAAVAEEGLLRCLTRLGRFGEAEAVARDAARREPDPRRRARLLLLRSTILADHLNQLEQAQACASEAQTLWPGLPLASSRAMPPSSGEIDGASHASPSETEATRTVRVPLAALTSEAGPRGHALDLPMDIRVAAPPEDSLHALRSREHALRESRRFQELMPILEKRLSMTVDPIEQSTLLAELGELQAEAGLTDRALASFEQALAHHEGHPAALWGLARLFVQRERWPDLAQVFMREAEAMEAQTCRHDAWIRAAIIWEERASDPGQADALYQRVLREDPQNEEAFKRRMALLTSAKEWSSIAAMLRARISGTTQAERSTELLLELGLLYLHQLGEPSKGAACLGRALQLCPDHAGTLQALGDLHAHNHEWTLAQACYSRVLATALDPQRKRLLHRRLGEVQLQLKQPLQALNSLRLALTNPETDDVELLHNMLEAAEGASDPEVQVHILEHLAPRAEAPMPRVALLRKLARLYHEERGSPERAIPLLEQVVELSPLDLDATLQLAAVHGSLGDRGSALAHMQRAAQRHREALKTRPFDGGLHRQLGQIFKWQRLNDALFCSCVARTYLESLGEKDLLDVAERRFQQQHQYRCGPVPVGPLDRLRYEQLILPEEAKGPLRQLLALARDGLLRRIAMKPEALGLDSSSLIVAEHPLRILCNEMASQLGRVDFDLYVSTARPKLIAAEMLNRPALILGSAVAQSVVGPADRFRIGRALFLIGENGLLLSDLSVRRVQALLAALGRVADPPFAMPGLSVEPAAIEAEVLQLRSVVSEDEKRRLGAALPHLGEALADVNIPAYKDALRCGANRAGLVVGGDPQRCLEEARALADGEGGGPLMADLLRFLVGDGYFTLRRELGIAPGSSGHPGPE